MNRASLLSGLMIYALASAAVPSLTYAAPSTPRDEANEVTLAFRDALTCFAVCKGSAVNPEHPPPNLGVPPRFSDLLARPVWKQKFLAMLRELPSEFTKFAVIQPGEDSDLVMEGSLYFVISSRAGTFYVYRWVGLPEGIPPRRPKGSLDVIVDSQQLRMAGIWNGPDDLSQYRFFGPAYLLSPLIAYKAAAEAEMERAYKVSRTEEPASVVLPIPLDRLGYTKARLNYLDSLINDGNIEGAKSAFDAGDELRKADEPPTRTWYAIDISHTDCIKSISPALRIKVIRDDGFKETTRDTNDANGNLVEVQVSHAEGLYILTNTYYTTKEACMAALAKEQAVPDKYR